MHREVIGKITHISHLAKEYQDNANYSCMELYASNIGWSDVIKYR
jgi:hypothetical protein